MIQNAKLDKCGIFYRKSGMIIYDQGSQLLQLEHGWSRRHREDERERIKNRLDG